MLKSKKNRIIPLLLILSFAIALLASCGRNKEKTEISFVDEKSPIAEYYARTELEGFDGLKNGAVLKSDLAGAQKSFKSDKIEGIYTYKRLEGDVRGAGKEETLLVYMVVSDGTAYPVFALNAEETVYYKAFDYEWQEVAAPPEETVSFADGVFGSTMELYRFTPEEKANVWIAIPSIGSGGSARLYAYTYENGALKSCLNNHAASPSPAFSAEYADGGDILVNHRDKGPLGEYKTKLAEAFPDRYGPDGKYIGVEKQLNVDSAIGFYWLLSADGFRCPVVKYRFWPSGMHPYEVGYGYETLKFDPLANTFSVTDARVEICD